ncbi:LamB/YcsF family protein [Bifidobacterium adolescentis]|nr:LamB/YcsF family protein [Bifidobacterium adolescentis]MDB1408338.1 LamB/YcsF family protein [Bifidobacterium adolescentis]MDB1411694.1 LamB/YcsF family protein [Bifidobacterium adolescentis]
MSAVVAGSVTGIDMNSDMGESFGRWKLGDDEALLDVVSSANVACGFHAGDPSVMLRTLSYAASREVMVGAHVAYRDLAGFGRRYVDESPDELKADVLDVIVEYGGLDGVHMTNVATVDGLEPDRYFKQVGQLTDCARS